MARPIRCLLLLHAWTWRTNDEGQKYQECERCGAFRDFTPSGAAS